MALGLPGPRRLGKLDAADEPPTVRINDQKLVIRDTFEIHRHPVPVDGNLPDLRIGPNGEFEFLVPRLCASRAVGQPVADDGEHRDEATDQQHAEKDHHIFQHADIGRILLLLRLRC